MLALKRNNFDFENNKITIVKTFHRKNGADVFGATKTRTSKRSFTIPQSLADEIKEYIDSLYGVEDDSRLFEISKSSLYRVMEKGCAASGVKRITIHGLRHSHITLLGNCIGGSSMKGISNRAGHASVNMTMLYTHLYDEQDERIARNLNTLMEDE